MSIFFKLLTVSLLFCHVTSAQGEVNVAGTTGAIMHQSDLSTHINIDTLGMKHLYGHSHIVYYRQLACYTSIHLVKERSHFRYRDKGKKPNAKITIETYIF